MKEYISKLQRKLYFLLAIALILPGFLFGIIADKDYIRYDYETGRYYANKIYDFSKIRSITKRKKMFIDFMSLIIKTENDEVLLNRIRIEELSKKNDLTKDDFNFINNIEKVYLMDISETYQDVDWDELLHRVDIVPVDLAITQAAIESGWGTSGFALEANNLYGQWTYKVGSGIVPKRRDNGHTHEIAKFSSVNDSVKKYMLNLNTNRAYSNFRNLRAELRNMNTELCGVKLSEGLVNYSGIGDEYIIMINSIINDVSKILEN
ncbi:glucosaminidase domain-containing protein [bacterium]|nr:glucosaminidase domain-containing protein [bacterium]